MTAVRPAAVAGWFYPDDAEELSETVDSLLEGGSADGTADVDPVALVVPHAGYRCSGGVAAVAYRLLRRCGDRFRTVVVVGPAHFRDVAGLAVPACRAWSTPLGEVDVDAALRSRLVELGLARALDAAHDGEHSMEVQVPFLQRVLAPGWSVLPVAARSVRPEAVADCIDAVAGDGVLVVLSTDLSHYHDEPTAVALDRRTAEAVLRRDVEAVRDEDVCGAEALRGLLEWARRHDLAMRLLDVGTSADTCSGPDRVVGYGAFAVTRPGTGG